MGESSTDSTTNTIPLATILGIVFITLKLYGIIDWSWWWVLAPFWAGIAIFGFFFCVVFLFALFSGSKIK